MNGHLETSTLTLNSSHFKTNQCETKAPITATNFWRPFTIELIRENAFTGLSLEKKIRKNVFVRASFSSDLNLKSRLITNPSSTVSRPESFFVNSPVGIKLSMGFMFNILNIDCINTSIRSGLEIGMKQKSEEIFFGSRVSRLLGQVPLLIQFRFLKHYSIDFGVKPSVDRLIYPGTISSVLTNQFFYEWEERSFQTQIHIGLRYTFAEKQ